MSELSVADREYLELVLRSPQAAVNPSSLGLQEMVRRGLIVVEARLTEEGRAALKEKAT